MNVDINKMIEIGVEVKLKKDFNVIREMLERIGIANKEKKILYPSCNILHKRGCYFIVHYKELFILDGKQTSLDATDVKRRDSVVYLLSKWDMIEPCYENIDNFKTNEFLFILKKHDKDNNNWEILPKYQIGKFKK